MSMAAALVDAARQAAAMANRRALGKNIVTIVS